MCPGRSRARPYRKVHREFGINHPWLLSWRPRAGIGAASGRSGAQGGNLALKNPWSRFQLFFLPCPGRIFPISPHFDARSYPRFARRGRCPLPASLRDQNLRNFTQNLRNSTQNLRNFTQKAAPGASRAAAGTTPGTSCAWFVFCSPVGAKNWSCGFLG